MNDKLNTIEEAGWAELAKYQAAGSEFDWFGRDIEGHLAVFTSAGEGPIPGAIWNHLREYNALVTHINSLPDNGCVQVFEGDNQYQEWLNFADVGLFSFDYHDVHRVRGQRLAGYDLIARPSSPITCNALGIDLVSWLPVLNVAFTQVAFVRDATVAGSIYRLPNPPSP